MEHPRISVLSAAIGVFNAASAPSVYRADARLLAQINAASVAGLTQFEPVPFHWLFFETQSDIILSRAVAASVVRQLELDKPDEPKTERPAASQHPLMQRWRELRDAIPNWRDYVPQEWRQPEPPPLTREQRFNRVVEDLRTPNRGRRTRERGHTRWFSVDRPA